MFIHEMFQQKPCVFSVEVFPPKKAGAAEETLYPVLRELCTLGPDYISVTYGAGGGTAGQSTAKIASYIKNGLHVEALAHLTCVNSTRVQVEETLTRLREDNVENVLALRGDINPDLPRRMDFLHASDLAKAIAQTGGFGVCCFSKRMRKLFRKNEKSVLRFCNKSSKTKRAFTKVLMPCKRPF